MSENDERLAVQGPQGPQGKRGEKGTAGLSSPVRRALAFLIVLNLVAAGANTLWTAHEVTANSQQRCSSIEADVRIPVPHPVAGNPSREWEAAYEAIERKRAAQLGCAGGG